MSQSDLELRFTNSCIPLEYPCDRGDKYVDPCTCRDYFLCEHQTNIIRQVCSAGTLFNHVSENCERAEDVAIINKQCDVDRPWRRCVNATINDEASPDIPALIHRCTGIRPTTETPAGGSQQQTGGDNSGAIAGAVVGVLLVIGLIILVFFLLKRRGKPLSHYLTFLSKKKSASKHKDQEDETYAEISDMNTPVYNDSVKSVRAGMPTGGDRSPRVPDRPTFTMSPALNVNQDSQVRGHGHEEVAYDNPGYTPSDDDIIQAGVRVVTSRDDVIQGSTRPQVSPASDLEESYSGLDSDSLEVPAAKPYTPLSVYTRGPNPHATPGSAGGILQVTDTDYQVPRPLPEYYELDPASNSVS